MIKEINNIKSFGIRTGSKKAINDLRLERLELAYFPTVEEMLQLILNHSDHTPDEVEVGIENTAKEFGLPTLTIVKVLFLDLLEIQ